jgi:hypothetical protein
MHSESLRAFETVIEAPGLPVKVDMIGAFLTGVTFSRYLIGEGQIADMDSTELVPYLTDIICAIIDRDPSSSSPPNLR